jgi:plasmid stabilization system protein ParE
MQITKVYWREDALNNMKDILASYKGKGRVVTKRIVDYVAESIEILQKRPHNGYFETSLADQPQKIYAYYIANKNLKVLYYVEDDALYVVDVQDD